MGLAKDVGLTCDKEHSAPSVPTEETIEEVVRPWDDYMNLVVVSREKKESSKDFDLCIEFKEPSWDEVVPMVRNVIRNANLECSSYIDWEDLRTSLLGFPAKRIIAIAKTAILNQETIVQPEHLDHALVIYEIKTSTDS